MIRRFSALIGLVLISSLLPAQADAPYPSLSPRGSLTQVVGNTTLSIAYERPAARQREVFGALVPWNEVWRTGAGQCTKLRFDRPVAVGGQAVPAGTYSLFTIPRPDQWIVILNRDTTLYGSYNYDASRDVARFLVTPRATDRYYEALNFDIDLVPNNARIYLSWAHTQIDFLVETTTDREVESFIQEQLRTGRRTDADAYAGAADYYLYQNRNYQSALALADQALAIDPHHGWAWELKISINDRLGRYAEALKVLDQARQRARDNPNYSDEVKQQEVEHYDRREQEIKQKM